MSKTDYYQLLGVNKNASQQEIKKAFRRSAMKYHPDRKPGDKGAEAKFKEMNEAYKVLSDPKMRQRYDQFGHAGVQQGSDGGSSGFGTASGFDSFSNIFNDMFGGGRGGRQSDQVHRGNDLQYRLSVPLESVLNDATRNIRVPTLVPCGSCAGSGAKSGSKPINCPTCQGHGEVRIQQGFLAIQQTCPSCHGRGKVIQSSCHTCHGEGRRKETKTLSVKIPAGVDTGDRIRLSGEGEAGMNGGPSGDLYVQITVQPHDIFKRSEDDLKCEVPISMAVAALGGEIVVPTLQGRVNLKIPPETQSGKLFRLRSKGIQSARGTRIGDLFCEVVVETPVNLSREQKQLLGDLQASIDNDPKRHNPKKDSWFTRMRSFFESI